MITLIIIGITVLVSIAAMENPELKGKLMFNAFLIHHKKQWYRFFSNGLIHANWLHLLLNMYALWMFGKGVEGAFSYEFIYGAKGPYFFILLYAGGLIMSSLYSYEKHKHDMYYNSLGASGAVMSVMFAYVVLAPTAKLGLIFLPFVQVPAYILGLMILALEHYFSRRPGTTGIAHDAHYWGAIYGIVFTIAMKPSLAMDFIHKIQGTY